MELSTLNCWSTFKALILCQLLDNRSFQSCLNPGRQYSSRQLAALKTVDFTATKILSILGVDFPVYRSIQNYQNPVNFKSWHSRSFQSYLTPESGYASRQLLELTTIAFRAIKILSTVGVDIPVSFSFQSYQNPVNFKSWHSLSFQSYQTPGRLYTSN